MTEIHTQKVVFRPFVAFKDRQEAGQRLADYVNPSDTSESLVLALPRGGVPVAVALAKRIGAPLQPVLVRKLPIPSSPEMGFGAVAIDGSRILNAPVVEYYRVTEKEIESITAEVREEVRRRARAYVGHDLAPPAEGRVVYMVDDGLATGYSMIAAATMVRKLNPRRVVLAIPVSPYRSILAVRSYFDSIFCLFAKEVGPFAVASYYEDFHDLSDDEVTEILRHNNSAMAS